MTQFSSTQSTLATPDDPDAIETVIIPRARDIGGFEVRRALPSTKRQMIGPFIFFDQIGPGEFITGEGIDVRPHPHIGLATVTYLFDGEIIHRDSLGYEEAIRPGDINWMTSGKGIVHSERTSQDLRKTGSKIFGNQSWIALPKDMEEVDPEFLHTAKADLPTLEAEGKKLRLVIGELFGERSPVKTFSETFYADVELEAGAQLPLPADHEERGVHIFAGEVEIAGQRFAAGQFLVFRPGDEITIIAKRPSRIVLLGGEPMDGPRHMWWNFVSSSKERIEQAKHDWKAGKFDKVISDAEEFIPLPEK